MYTILLVIHSILVIFMIIMVLIQRTDSDGLSGLGGGGGNQFLSGRATANLMTRATAFLAGGFMLTSLVLAIMASRMTEHSIIDAAPAAESSTQETVPANDNKPTPAPEKPVKQKQAPAPSVPKPE